MSSLPVATPHHRAIVLVDIEGSTARTNNVKARLRQSMYDMLKKAMRMSGIAERHRDPMIDRGDGTMVLIHPARQVPKTLLLNAFVPKLTTLLAEHNVRSPDHQFRLRVAMHAGEVHYDQQGVFGEAIDLACRLLDAPEVKRKLVDTDAPLVLVVSDDIYRSLVVHGYDGIDHRAYEQLVRIGTGHFQHRGWVDVPCAYGQAGPRQQAPVLRGLPQLTGTTRVRPVTGDPTIDVMFHTAGQELDNRSTAGTLDPAAVVERIVRMGVADPSG